MTLRRAALVSSLVLLIALLFSLVALASAPAAPQAAPVGAPASESAPITATGTAVIPASSSDFVVGPQTLNVNVQTRATTSDVDSAIGDVQQRLLAIKAALAKAGVPSDGVRFTGLNVMPQLGRPDDKTQVLPQEVTGFIINASLQADIADLKLLVAAMDAATANGATQVNVGGGKGAPMQTVQPDPAALAKAMTDAIANARTVAQAIAAASGKTLGGVRSVTANQLYPACCPALGGWNVQVTVSFEISQ